LRTPIGRAMRNRRNIGHELLALAEL